MKLPIITFLALSLFFDSYTAHQAVIKKNAADNGWDVTDDGIKISGPLSDSSTIEEEQKSIAYGEQELTVCHPYDGKGAVPREVAVRFLANLEIRKKKLHGEKLPVPPAPQAPKSLPPQSNGWKKLRLGSNRWRWVRIVNNQGKMGRGPARELLKPIDLSQKEVVYQVPKNKHVPLVIPNASGNHWGLTENGEEISGPPQDDPACLCQPYIRKHITHDGTDIWDF